MRHRSRLVLALGALSAAAALAAAAPPAGQPGHVPGHVLVHVDVAGLRSAKGVVRACMTQQRERFPECRGNAADRELAVSAEGTVSFDFGAVAPGRYAIALLHDENGNGRMDRALLLMPKEGYGFSRDAPVRMGPPSFGQAAFEVAGAPIRQTIRMRYML